MSKLSINNAIKLYKATTWGSLESHLPARALSNHQKTQANSDHLHRRHGRLRQRDPVVGGAAVKQQVGMGEY